MATTIPSPADAASGQAYPPATRKRRRLPRASQACQMCRTRKTKCDQQVPCSLCSYHDFECRYSPSTTGLKKSRETQVAANRNTSLVSRHPGPRTPHENMAFQRPQSTNPTSQSLPHLEDQRFSSPATTRGTADHHSQVDMLEREEPNSASTCEVETALMREQLLTKDTEGEMSALGGVNAHTQGTEFYGGSSNLAFLNTLFARARIRARSCSGQQDASSRDGDSIHGETDSPGHLCNSQLSIVDLMYNADYPTAPNSSASPASGSQGRGIHQSPSHATPGCGVPNLEATDVQTCSSYKREIERYFVDSYFANKHQIHPFLDESRFRAQCSKIWAPDAHLSTQKQSSTFNSLYYSVLAVGAINAPLEGSLDFIDGHQPAFANRTIINTLEWANWYFDLAQRALGNTFQISTLETCQALFILTVFCQNALKPHSSYLYSGMAVRTAIAIGLTNETYGNTLLVKQEARRTWWCIYSHEVEMCCSSGRVDGVKDPQHYLTPLPSWTSSDLSSVESDKPKFAMISVMVDLAQILQAASQDIYHDVSKQSLHERSQISFRLDAALDTWKKRLPHFLDLESFALDDSEWAFKQKLVLKFRSYNARIIIHRPFLVASSTSYDTSEFLRHVEICLEASRATIQVIHESLAHRPYLRTWWYCTTYTLYASMIILHLVLLDFPKVPGEELIEDVEKSLEIFSLMGKSITVAKRCGELTQEILGVAKKYLGNRRNRQIQSAHFTPPSFPNDVGADIFGLSLPDKVWDDEHLIALLNQEEPGPSRANALANFLDPSILEGFVTGCGYD